MLCKCCWRLQILLVFWWSPHVLLVLDERGEGFTLDVCVDAAQGIAMFRFIASVCRNETVASTGGAFFFLVLLLLGGFLLARGGML